MGILLGWVGYLVVGLVFSFAFMLLLEQHEGPYSDYDGPFLMAIFFLFWPLVILMGALFAVGWVVYQLYSLAFPT